MLFLSGNFFAMVNQKLSKKDKECCELVSQALLRAHVGLYCKVDNNFPRRNSESVMLGNIPVNFTTEKAYLCRACDEYYLRDKPKVGDMIVVVPSTKDAQGSITVKLERADYDDLTEEIYNSKMEN